jgi:hypothetical protein
MRYNDFKIVEATLFKKASDIKYYDTVNELIAAGQTFALGANGDEGVFVINKGQKITANTQILNGEGSFKGEDITSIKANQLYKSPQIINLGAGRDAEAVTSTSQKETHIVKPSQIFKDEKFNATQVFDEVIRNSVLQDSDIGLAIIKMAQEIQAGNLPEFKTLPAQFQPAIRDYAGEYLGVLALIKGIANFPTRDEWFNHLGVTDLNKIQIYFPPESNNPLGDSEGYFQNTETGNQILISSKGGKKGAPPSLNGLKIPDNLRTPEYEADINIIETLQGASAATQPFVGINALLAVAPDSLSKEIREIGVISDQDMSEMQTLMNQKSYSKKDYKKLLDPKFIKLINRYVNMDRVNERATPGGIVHYAYNKALLEAVNQNNAMPNFEPLAREILQQNFIQIFARPTGTQLGFDVLWPNREMATGKIQLYSKASTTEPGKGKLSFSVTD